MKKIRKFQRSFRALLVLMVCVMSIPLQSELVEERIPYHAYVTDSFIEVPVQGAEKQADEPVLPAKTKSSVKHLPSKIMQPFANSHRIAVKISPDQLQAFQKQWEVDGELSLSITPGVVVFDVKDEEEAELLSARLDAHPMVDFVEQDRPIRAAEISNDPYSKDQAHFELLDTPAIWKTMGDDAQLVVAVLDTGVDDTHPDLAERIMTGYNFIDESAFPHDDNGHGTHVAGIIAAIENNGEGVAGVCPNCRIMPLKVLDENSTGTLFDLVDAIYYAVDHGANVLNMSLTTDECSPMLQEALDYAWERGVLSVAAAGNGGRQKVMYPAACEHVLAVGATAAGLDRADFSNVGDGLDVVAPGSNLWSTLPGGSYGQMSGTSMATPIVAGFVAMTRMMRPELNPADIERVIQRTAEDLGEPGRDRRFGYGLVSVPHLSKSSDFHVTGASGPTLQFAFHPLQHAKKVELHQSTDGGKTWQTSSLAAPLGTDSMFATVFNLRPATHYLFRLHVIGGPYHGVSSHVRYKTAVDTIPPSMPRDLRVVERGKQTMTVNWAPSKDNKGIKHYEVLVGERIVGNPIKPTIKLTLRNLSQSETLRVVAIDRYDNRSSVSMPLELVMLK
jgi:subtilisin family serine protease